MFLHISLSWAKPEPEAEIIEVQGGSTLVGRYNGKVVKIKVIGLGLSSYPNKNKVEAKIAGAVLYKAREILKAGTKVKLLFDNSNSAKGHLDKLGRLLAHVILPDGTFYAEKMIKEGYGRAIVKYPFDPKIMEKYLKVEKEARKNGKGLWRTDNKYGDWFWQ